jgi:hypothetical protein
MFDAQGWATREPGMHMHIIMTKSRELRGEEGGCVPIMMFLSLRSSEELSTFEELRQRQVTAIVRRGW